MLRISRHSWQWGVATLSVLLTLVSLAIKAENAMDTATTQVSEQSLYRVSCTSQLDPIAINQIHSWVLHVETASGEPVADAEIAVNGGMPAHNHGLPTAPRVTRYLGNGDYLVEGVKFQMNGHWQVRFMIDAKGQRDKVTFNLML